jgi:putative oxidoreductase
MLGPSKEKFMKLASTVARYLLGFLFTVFGLNGFLHFIPAGPMPGLAGQFVMALAQSHYMSVVFALQLISGLLLLANRYVPLALTVLAPVVVNIVLFHVFLAPAGMPMAIVTVLLWIAAAYPLRPAFASLLQARALAR